MKRIIYLVGACLAAGLCGCESILEKTPDGQVTIDEILSNHERSEGLLTETYNEVYQMRDGISFVYSTFDALTDNTFWAANYNAYDWHNGALSLSNPVINWPWNTPSEQLWPDFWRGIRLANNAIKYIPQSTALTDQEKTTWVAEARVLRCWYYMQLLEFYGPMPWITEPFDPNYDGWNELTRPTYDEIATTLVGELDEVIDSKVLPNRRPAADSKHVDNGVARAIKARILLNNASLLNNPEGDKSKWERAAKAASTSPPTAYKPSNAASRRTRRASAPATSAASNSPTTARSCLPFSSILARANDPASPKRPFQAVLRIPSRRLLPPPPRRLENRQDPGATTYFRRLPALHSRHDCAGYPRGSRTPERHSGRGRVPRIQRFPAVIALLRVTARIVSFPRG